MTTAAAERTRALPWSHRPRETTESSPSPTPARSARSTSRSRRTREAPLTLNLLRFLLFRTVAAERKVAKTTARMMYGFVAHTICNDQLNQLHGHFRAFSSFNTANSRSISASVSQVAKSD